MDEDTEHALARARVLLERDAALAAFGAYLGAGMDVNAAAGTAWHAAQALVNACPTDTAGALAALELDDLMDDGEDL